MPKKVWTPERDAMLRELFPAVGFREAARLMGLPAFGVKARANLLGVRGDKKRRRVWTPDLDARLRAAHAAGGLAAACAALPDKTRPAVKNRVSQLGLHHPHRLWTAAEDAFVREHYGHDLSAPAIAARLGRGVPAVQRRVRKLGLDGNRNWSPAEVEKVRREYQTRGCVALAMELFGSAGPLERHRVYNLAGRLGVTTPVRHPRAVLDRVRELHARGLNDSQIAREMADVLPGRNRRERVTAIRARRLKLPRVEQTHADRVAMGRSGRLKQIASGVNPRDAAWAKLAASYGLPADTPPRAVEILLALCGGPKTRSQLKAATGRDPVDLWNRVGTSYLGGLARRGRPGRAKTPGAATRSGDRVLYTLTAEALSLLSHGKEPQ